MSSCCTQERSRESNKRVKEGIGGALQREDLDVVGLPYINTTKGGFPPGFEEKVPLTYGSTTFDSTRSNYYSYVDAKIKNPQGKGESRILFSRFRHRS